MEEQNDAKSRKINNGTKESLDKIRERYERSLEKDNRKIADLVRKHFGDEPDLKKLDVYFSRIVKEFADTATSSSESTAGRVQAVSKKDVSSSEQFVPVDGDVDHDE